MANKLNVATHSDEKKINIFKERLAAIYDCEFELLSKLFKNRPSDPFMIGYNSDMSKYAITFDGNEWKPNSIGEFDLYSAVTLPLRGSVWKSTKSFQFFMVTDFANIRSSRPKEEPPYIIFMDANGVVRTLHVVQWFKDMIIYNKKLL